MYKKIESTKRMTKNEATELYPNSYILIYWDNAKVFDETGTVLYIGDDRKELFSLVMQQDDPTNYGVSEGLNLQRSLGGLIIGV